MEPGRTAELYCLPAILDKTTNSALAKLRRDLIRNGGEGLVHVEALGRMKGRTYEPNVRVL